MLIRISLIIAIVAGLAAVGIGFVKVKEKIVTTMNERDQNAKDRDAEKAAKIKVQGELKTTKADLESTKNTLAKTQKDLEDTTAKADELTKQKTELTTQLATVKGERDAAQDKLVQWDFIKKTPDEVKKVIADLATTQKERDVFVAENKTLLRERNKLQAKLDDLIGPNQDPELPTGLKGQVVAVDPKYDFVVINIGGNQGVLERGVMLVNRGGKLVAKVRVASVSPDRSIANILPEWKQAEVIEGDQVLY
ncbi:MAG: hypothetical protein ABIR24_02765 [Verrucomicrobiota bacterium]